MNFFYRCFERSIQGVLYVGCFFMGFHEPKVIQGEDVPGQVAKLFKEKGKKAVLIVTDDMIFKLGLTKKFEDALKKEEIPYAIYHEVVPNPTVHNVEDGLKIYKENKCDAVLPIGGGSSMDCAKMIAARSTNPKKPVGKMGGLFKVTHKPDLIVAVPTTAGTGSETTVAAVISDPENKGKYACEDTKLIPSYAALEPSLLIGLPGKVTSTTGIDALCHAVEAYIGWENTSKTKKFGKEAVKGIYDYLYLSYQNPTNLEYRQKMQLAAYQAGVAFTRAYVGYVHSMSHALGALYNTPHGLAISITLPYLLEAYGEKSYKKLAELADYCGMTKPEMTREQKAKAFIQWIKDIEQKMGIPNTIKGIADPKDFPVLAEHAVHEANPIYPCPKIFNKEEIIELYKKMYI
jgi:alcohol dehydrogenase